MYQLRGNTIFIFTKYLERSYCPKQFFLVVCKGVTRMDTEADEITRASMNSRHCSIRKVSIQHGCTIPSSRMTVRMDRVHAKLRIGRVHANRVVRPPSVQTRLSMWMGFYCLGIIFHPWNNVDGTPVSKYKTWTSGWSVCPQDVHFDNLGCLGINTPKELPKNIIIIFLVNRSTSIEIALIHSVLICEMNTMRNFCFSSNHEILKNY